MVASRRDVGSAGRSSQGWAGRSRPRSRALPGRDPARAGRFVGADHFVLLRLAPPRRVDFRTPESRVRWNEKRVSLTLKLIFFRVTFARNPCSGSRSWNPRVVRSRTLQYTPRA